MSVQTLHFELVSPEARLMQEPALQVNLPGSEGDMGILPGHASLVSSLRPGVVEVVTVQDKGVTEGAGTHVKIFIAGGFADISGSQCTILAEEAIRVEDLDHDALTQELKNLNEDLNLHDDPKKLTKTHHQITITQAKLAAI